MEHDASAMGLLTDHCGRYPGDLNLLAMCGFDDDVRVYRLQLLSESLYLRTAQTHPLSTGSCRQSANGSGVYQCALRNDHHVVSRLLHLREDVTGDQHGGAIASALAQQRTQPGHAFRIQAVGGFIQDQHAGIPEQCPGKRQPLLHAQ